jgi:hypothetical protein
VGVCFPDTGPIYTPLVISAILLQLLDSSLWVARLDSRLVYAQLARYTWMFAPLCGQDALPGRHTPEGKKATNECGYLRPGHWLAWIDPTPAGKQAAYGQPRFCKGTPGRCHRPSGLRNADRQVPIWNACCRSTYPRASCWWDGGRAAGHLLTYLVDCRWRFIGGAVVAGPLMLFLIVGLVSA